MPILAKTGVFVLYGFPHYPKQKVPFGKAGGFEKTALTQKALSRYVSLDEKMNGGGDAKSHTFSPAEAWLASAGRVR